MEGAGLGIPSLGDRKGPGALGRLGGQLFSVTRPPHAQGVPCSTARLRPPCCLVALVGSRPRGQACAQVLDPRRQGSPCRPCLMSAGLPGHPGAVCRLPDGPALSSCPLLTRGRMVASSRISVAVFLLPITHIRRPRGCTQHKGAPCDPVRSVRVPGPQDVAGIWVWAPQIPLPCDGTWLCRVSPVPHLHGFQPLPENSSCPAWAQGAGLHGAPGTGFAFPPPKGHF